MSIEKLLSLREVQENMGVSYSTLYRLRRKKLPPFDREIRLSRRVLLPESVFNAYVLSTSALPKEDQNGFGTKN